MFIFLTSLHCLHYILFVCLFGYQSSGTSCWYIHRYTYMHCQVKHANENQWLLEKKITGENESRESRMGLKAGNGCRINGERETTRRDTHWESKHTRIRRRNIKKWNEVANYKNTCLIHSLEFNALCTNFVDNSAFVQLLFTLFCCRHSHFSHAFSLSFITRMNFAFPLAHFIGWQFTLCCAIFTSSLIIFGVDATIEKLVRHAANLYFVVVEFVKMLPE